MVAGRKPEITAARTDPDRAPMRTETGDIVSMDPPDDLSDEGAEVWKILLPDLIASKVFRLSDAILLSELCESLAMARGFRHEVQALQRRLANSASEEEAEKISALLKRARTGYRQMLQTSLSISGEFGISPVARLRLGLMAAQGNSLLGLMDGGRGDAGSS